MKRPQIVRAVLKTVLLFGSLQATPAYAASATPEGAKELQASVAKVIGPRLFEMGVVSIAPQGDTYALKLDFNVLSAKANAAGVKFSIDPLVYMLTPKDDGTYAVTSDSALNYSFSTGAGDTYAQGKTKAECKSSGVFEPKILFFSSFEVSCSKMTRSLSNAFAKAGVSLDEMSMSFTGKASASGGVDLVVTSTAHDFIEKIAPAEGAAVPFTAALPFTAITTKSMTSELTIGNARLGSLLSIISLLANASNAGELIERQDSIKKLLLDVLPVWDMVSGKLAGKDISVETMHGVFRFSSFGETFGLTGVTRQAYAELGLKYNGLELPGGKIPAWAAELIPTEGNFDVKIGGIDLDAMIRLLIENVDATRDPPVTDEVFKMLTTTLHLNPPTLSLSQGTLKAASGELAVEGKMNLFPGLNGRFTITVANLDKMIGALQSADARSGNHLKIFATFAKGIAKTRDDGKSVWKVDFDEAIRSVIVNDHKL